MVLTRITIGIEYRPALVEISFSLIYAGRMEFLMLAIQYGRALLVAFLAPLKDHALREVFWFYEVIYVEITV